MNSTTHMTVSSTESTSTSPIRNSGPAAAEPIVSASMAGTNPACSMRTPNATKASGSTMSARSESEPEQHQGNAKHHRKEAGAHAQRGTERIVTRDKDRDRTDRDQHHAG